jgi:3-oxoacyl-[acyl-carrier-protein] synthase II
MADALLLASTRVEPVRLTQTGFHFQHAELNAALRDAELDPSDIGHVNAHGAATVDSDLAEARALNRVFGNRTPDTALKGYIGNLASGCASVELLGRLLALREGAIPQTLHCDEPDPACPIDVIHSQARFSSNPRFLKMSLTRYGQAAALVVASDVA